MQILKVTGIDWHERRLISNVYMAQKVKVQLNRGETKRVKVGREVRKNDAVCHRFCSTCTANALPRKLWKGVETSKYEDKSFTQ